MATSPLKQMLLRQQILKNVRFSSASASPSAGAHGEASQKLWKRLTLFMGLPIVAAVSAQVIHKELTEPHSRPEFKPYDHLRIRRKNFPWGDGKKSFFHNPHTNALPTGYEDDHH